MKKIVQLGIIGAGGSRIMYGPSLKYLSKVAVAAVADPSPKARELAQRELRAGAVYESVEDMLGSAKLDGVIVSSPVFCHVEHVLAVAKAGLPVLVEKPMARTPAEAKQMVKACRKAGVLLMVGFNRRLLPPLWTATQIAQSGQLGDVFHVECIWTHCGQHSHGWRDSSECFGGVFQDHGSHTIDLCRQWLGEVKTVYAHGRRGRTVDGQFRGVEDHLVALITHKGGSSYHINARDSHRPVSELYRLYGAKGTLEVEYTGGWSYIAPDNWEMRMYRNGNAVPERLVSRRPRNEWLTQLPDGHYAFGAEIKKFGEAIASRSATISPSGEEGLAVVRAVSAAFLSAAEGRLVTPPEADAFDQHMFEKCIRTITRS